MLYIRDTGKDCLILKEEWLFSSSTIVYCKGSAVDQREVRRAQVRGMQGKMEYNMD